MTEDAFTTSIHIDAEPSEVFPYLTDAELMVRWMGQWAELEPKPGGAFMIDCNGVPMRGEYVVVDPPSRVVFTWGAAGHEVLPPGSTTVEIVLHADDAGTRLELTHRDLPPEEIPHHAIGWDHFLGRLAVSAPGGDPGVDPWSSP